MTALAAGRYAELETDRQPYLDRARQAAKLTIPSLMPGSGANASTAFATPYQSIGARGLNNIASKLLLSLFPSNVMIFTLAVDEMTREEMTGQEGMQAEMDKALQAFVKKTMSSMETEAIRISLFEAIKHSVNSGNSLLYFPPAGGHRVYRLDSYVVKRDPGGKVLEIITKELISYQSLPEEVRVVLPVQPEPSDKDAGDASVVPPPTGDMQRPLELYTYVYREGINFHVYQEIEGIVVPGSVGIFPEEESPFVPIRFIKVDGEDYGRGYVEEYIGDLNTLEGLYKAVTEFAAIASQVKMFVNPNGVTNLKKVQESANGAILSGRADDLSTFQIDKGSDFRAVMSLIERIEGRLAHAFLLNTSIQRPGERVTAEEIKFMARELDDALGGIYAIQSQELQLPVIRIRIANLNRNGELPKLPKEIQPKVVAGMDALGRSQDLSNLDAFVGGTLQIAPEQIGPYINWADYLQRRGNSLGIDTAGLIKTEEELAQQRQQEQAMAMAQQGVGPAVQQAGQMAQNAQQAQE